MLKPQTLLNLLIEIVMLLLGLLLMMVGATGRFNFIHREGAWLVVAAVLMAIGVRTLLRAGRYATRWLTYTRGLSFALVGALMFVILVAPFAQARWLIATAGVILALRGLVTAVLLLRTASS
jgi:hypothetical protein